MLFDETTLEQCLKSMIYYCKHFLKQDGLKSNHFFDIELTDSLLPVTQKLINLVEDMQDIKKFSITTPSLLLKSQNMDTSVLLSNGDIFNSSIINNNINNNKPRIDMNNIISLQKKSKRSLFPIFFENSI